MLFKLYNTLLITPHWQQNAIIGWPTILGSRFPVIPGIPLLEDTSINHIQPLLYFPFANFLANPCGFVSTPSMMNMILTNQSTVPLNQESIITNEDRITIQRIKDENWRSKHWNFLLLFVNSTQITTTRRLRKLF